MNGFPQVDAGTAEDPARARIVLGYDGARIGVVTHRAQDEEWLCDVLAPGFCIAREGHADVEVELRADPDCFERLRRRGRAAGGELVDGAILDDSTERFQRWNPAPGGTKGRMQTAFDPLFSVFHEVDPGSRVRITAEGGELCRVALMRVVREFAMEASMRRGSVFLHAAAIRVGGQAIVIAGEKGAGKTTTLSFCLQLLEEATFIANDRVRVRETERGFEVRAMPTVMSFRPAGLSLLPSLEAAVRTQRGMPFHSRSELDDRDDIGPVVPFSDGRIGLSPTRYPELLERGSAAAAPAAAIVFPEVADDDGGLRPEPIDPGEVVPRLSRTLFGAAALDRQSELFALPQAGPFPSTKELLDRAGRVGEGVPAWRWRVGRGATRDARGLRNFLSSLPRDAA